MTNINCLQNCIYQEDGKCTLEYISTQNLTPQNSCAYFSSTITEKTNLKGNRDFFLYS